MSAVPKTQPAPLRIPFNKPYMTGKELWNIAQAHTNLHLAGDGEFTRRCHAWLERTPQVHKALLTHSCTAALEMAAWDLEARLAGRPLCEVLGASAHPIESGVSIGIHPSVEALVERVEQERAAGYRRVKLKIKPGWDVRPVEAVRARFGDIPLMVDANAAYTLRDASHLAELDRFELMMIEQPLGHDDLIQHARLQKQLNTPICLDETVASVERAELALDLGSCKYINIKPGRCGGITNAIKIHDLAKAAGVPCWIGGIAARDGKPSAEVLRKAVIALKCMEHRGGVCGDAGDGAGLTAVIPQPFFKEEAKRLRLDGARYLKPEDTLAVGVVFILDTEPARIDSARRVVRDVLSGGPVRFLGFRATPTSEDALAKKARAARPGAIEQALFKVEGDVAAGRFLDGRG